MPTHRHSSNSQNSNSSTNERNQHEKYTHKRSKANSAPTNSVPHTGTLHTCPLLFRPYICYPFCTCRSQHGSEKRRFEEGASSAPSILEGGERDRDGCGEHSSKVQSHSTKRADSETPWISVLRSGRYKLVSSEKLRNVCSTLLFSLSPITPLPPPTFFASQYYSAFRSSLYSPQPPHHLTRFLERDRICPSLS